MKKEGALVFFAFLAYTIGALFLSLNNKFSQTSVLFLSPGTENLKAISSLYLIIPFVFLIIAGILVVIHVKHIRKLRDKKKLQKTFDKLVYFVGFAGPLATLPQLYSLWHAQSAIGISPTSWFFYLGFAFVWLSYGIIHKYKPIIISNCLWIIIQTLMIIGIILFG